MTKIAVLVSIGRHPVSGTPRYSRNDAAALALGLSLAGAAGIDVLHSGDAATPALREYLALGAARVVVVPHDAAGDPVPALALALKDYDLVLTGSRAEDGIGSGMVPYQLAAALGHALVPDAVALHCTHDEVVAKQFLPKGLRRNVAATLPAVVTVHPLANVTPRYAYARMQRGSIDALPVQGSEAGEAGNAADAQPSDAAQAWCRVPLKAKPVRLVAAEKRSGHARMLSATQTESRGGSVVNAGSPVEKAQTILAYLREHQLVDY